MHKIRMALATAATAATACTLLAGPAQAASDTVQVTHCNAWYQDHKEDGFFRAFDAVDCYELLGEASGNDANWADGSGTFRGSDNDAATSLLNTGTYAGGINNVMVFSDAGPNGYMGCMSRGEIFVDDLRDNTLFNANGLAMNANNKISGHEWTSWCYNALT
ncbi:hypothetical protein [Streptomyces sp. NPDC047070]|uniref:hypothetical protein n=1 Tax=Streptomyces sp. NPDC047070 TaxID=3154923 RepID=UPI003456D44F